MSVVDQVAKVDLNPATKEAKSRLAAAIAILEDGKSTDSAKAAARLQQLTELIELEKFRKIVDLEPTLGPEHSDFVAYALYRIQDLHNLRKFVAKAPSVCGLLSLAQAEYKAGNLDKAREVLDSVRGDAEGDDLNDIFVNLSAIAALNGDEMPDVPQGVYDDAYNKGCCFLTRGLFKEALESFEKAIGVADEDDDRLSAIVQTGVVYFFMGEHVEARKRFEQVASDLESLPKSLRLVVLNNLAVLDYDGSMESAHEVLKAYDGLRQGASTLNGNQRVVIERNYLKLSARVGVTSIMRRASEHSKAYPSDLEPMVTALTYVKTPAEIKQMAHNRSAAAKLWIAATQNDQKFLDHEVRNTKLKMGSYGSLSKAIKRAIFHGFDAEYAAYFQSLYGTACETGLVILGPRDQMYDRISKLDQDEIKEMEKGVDVEALLAKGPPVESKKKELVAKRKRGGKKHYPKDYDPAAQPDPERWLAKVDRSSFNPKKAKTSQATQGAGGETAEVHTAGAASTSQVLGAKKTKPKKKGRK